MMFGELIAVNIIFTGVNQINLFRFRMDMR